MWVRWRLPSSSATEHQGHTEKAPLSNHRASWNYEKAVHVRLTIDRNSMLQECDVNFEVFQEFHSSPINEKHVLGKIKLNLAEYVDKVDEDEGVVRRYLMSDCKVNSTLKIGIAMRQIEGDRNFTTYGHSVGFWSLQTLLTCLVHHSNPPLYSEESQEWSICQSRGTLKNLDTCPPSLLKAGKQPTCRTCTDVPSQLPGTLALGSYPRIS